MAQNKPNPITKYTPQEIQNLSFDKDLGVLAILLKGYDSGSGELVPLKVDSSGIVQTSGGGGGTPGGSSGELQWNDGGAFAGLTGSSIDGSFNLTLPADLILPSTTSTTNPLLTFVGDTDTGIGRSAADTLVFITGGSTRGNFGSNGVLNLNNGLSTTGNALNSGYLRVGSTSAPNNSSAGDITGLRLNIGNVSSTSRLYAGGNLSSAAWGTAGIMANFAATTFTDTGSSGTVTNAYAYSIAAPTFAAASTTTYTNAINLYVQAPAAGTNVTITKSAAAIFDGLVGVGASASAQLANFSQAFRFIIADTTSTDTGFKVVSSGGATNMRNGTGGFLIDPLFNILLVNGSVTPNTDNARDFGTTAAQWRTLYIGTSIAAGTGATPTAFVDVAASTTAKASLRVRSGTAPTSPNEGDSWNDSTQKAIITFVDGVNQVGSGVVFTATADKTVTNTTTETSAIGTGIGTLTLPANFLVAGKTLRIVGGGVYSTPVAGGSVVVRVKLGSTTVASVTTTALLTSAGSKQFRFEADIVCRSTGASGTVITEGMIEYESAAGRTFDPVNNGGATATVDTTASKLLDVTVQWDTADSGKITTTTYVAAEVLN